MPADRPEYARVPFADVGPIKVPDGLSDEQVLFLSDIFPTGYMARRALRHQARRVDRRVGLRPGRAIRHQERVPARRGTRDRHRPVPYRLRMARERAGAETLNYEEVDMPRSAEGLTGGRGPDACIDAVGMEAHAPGVMGAYDT